MKLLNQADGSIFNVKPKKTRDQAQCVKELVEIARVMEVNPGVLIEKSEWTNKTDPYVNGKRVLGEKRFSISVLADESGWILTRTA